ncbi:MAG: PAS domain S-box protein [Promethearchaeota archaeon]
MSTSLKDVNKLNQIISENIDDPIFILNENFVCEYVNTRDFGENKFFIDFAHPNETNYLMKLLKDVLKNGNAVGQARMKLEGNKYNWFEIKCKRIQLNNKSKKIFLICRDITYFKNKEDYFTKSQEKLNKLADSLPEIRYWKFLQSKEGIKIVQKTREMLELVIDNIPQLIYWKDKNLVYLGCNKNYAQINGMNEPSSIVGKTDNDLIWLKNDLSHILEIETQVIMKNSAEYNIIESLVMPDSNQVWFEINRIPLHDLEDNVVGILVTYENITDRKIAEQKLKESEEKYRGILENIKESYFEVDLKGNITFFNDSLSELIGYSRNELMGLNYKYITDEENRKKIFKGFNSVFKTGEPLSDFQYQIRNKSGENVICETSVYLNYDSKGNKIGFRGITREITEKYILEQKIKESEEKYRTIFNANPDYIFITDISGNILEMNPALLEKLGTTLEEIRGRNFAEFYAGDNIDELQEVIEKIRAGEVVKEIVIKAKSILGRIFEYEVNSVPLKEDGNIAKILNLARDISYRKEAEEKIKESEKKYHHLFENTPYAIWLIDEDGVIVDCNSTTNKLLSILEIEELIGKKFSEVISVLKRSEYLINMLEDRFKKFQEGERGGPLELQITRGDGKRIWLSIQSSFVKIGERNLTQAIIQDITEKKTAEQKIMESEIKYRHLFESSPYGIILVNRKGQIVDANPATETIFGRNIEELINESFLTIRIKPEKVLPLFKQRYESILNGKVVKSLEVQITRSQDGRKIWISIDDSLVEIGGETIFQVIVQDITEKKNAEQKLKKSQEELQILNRELEQKVKERTKDLIESERQHRTTINSLADPLHVVDRDLRIILINKELQNWLRELNINFDLHGKQIFEVFPFLPPKIHKEYMQVFDTGIPLITKETTILENADIITETRKIPIFHEGKVEQVITIIRDITESYNLEQELRESERKLREQNIELMKMDKIKNDFITMAAHELKTPLISISGYTDYILMKHKDYLNPEIMEDLKTIQRNVNRLEILMDQLLDVMKIDEEKLKLRVEPTNISNIINNCLNELSYLINEKNLEIILNIEPEVVLNVDPTRIMTVFTNLISNSIKFTPDYGWIEISTKKDKKNYIFEVKDNGIGLTESEIERLFKKFERIKQPIISKSVNIKDSGTGLGLYITKGIVNAHGGKIWATSEGENKGANFIFTLPF